MQDLTIFVGNTSALHANCEAVQGHYISLVRLAEPWRSDAGSVRLNALPDMYKDPRIEIYYYADDLKYTIIFTIFFDSMSNFPITVFDPESNFPRSPELSQPMGREEGHDT